MIQHVALDELDQQERVLDLTDEQAEALAGTGLVQVQPALGGRWSLRPCGKVGAVRVGDLQVEVRPKDKVGLTRLRFLLGYSRNPGFRPEDVAAFEEPELWPALAESLARLAEAATARGVLQGYRTVEEGLQTVRGRIRMSDQITRRPGLMVPVEVTYDEFTVDIPENQILRTAVRRMLTVPRRSTAAVARLAHIDGRLSEVSVLTPGAPLPRWAASRLNSRYQPALRLSEVVLRNISAEASAGGQQVAAFVVNMATVFEDFVGTALTEALARYPGGTKLQYADHLDEVPTGETPGIPMKVDVVHVVRKEPRLIFDAKYKAAGPNDTYPNADHYQMLAYCTALSVPRAWLVYAGGGSVNCRRIRNTGIEIVEYPLDLRVEPRELLSQVERLAKVAWKSSLRQPLLAS